MRKIRLIVVVAVLCLFRIPSSARCQTTNEDVEKSKVIATDNGMKANLANAANQTIMNIVTNRYQDAKMTYGNTLFLGLTQAQVQDEDFCKEGIARLDAVYPLFIDSRKFGLERLDEGDLDFAFAMMCVQMGKLDEAWVGFAAASNNYTAASGYFEAAINNAEQFIKIAESVVGVALKYQKP